MGDRDRHIDVLEHFRRIASEVEGREIAGLTSSTVIAELGIDSVALMEVIGCLEDDLDTTLPEDRLAAVKTLGDLEDLVLETLA